ncbi:hypothetical protein KR200_006203 [Drosophila serrata]|nr:hypothetical protein KR200_006203 [Drosophila serrata]
MASTASTPEPPQQKLITRTISTPQQSGLPQKRQFASGGASTKGVMHGQLSTDDEADADDDDDEDSERRLQEDQRPSDLISDPDPVKCRWLKKWIKKCDDDSETSNWIAANTKKCPKCSVAIEKDGGCNHMVCKNQNCKNKFCWVWLGSWEPHGSSWYNSNSAHDEADADDNEESEVQHCYGPGKLHNAQSTQYNEPENVHKPAGNRSLNAAAYIAIGASNGSGVDRVLAYDPVKLNEPENVHKPAGNRCLNAAAYIANGASNGSGVDRVLAYDPSNKNLQAKHKQPLKLTVVTSQEQRYNGLNCLNTGAAATEAHHQDHFHSAAKRPVPEASVCLRWCLYQGRDAGAYCLSWQPGDTNSNTLKLNTRTALAVLENGNSSTGISTVTLSPAAIERDLEGRPLRRGYVPVEQNIQQELQDLKTELEASLS